MQLNWSEFKSVLDSREMSLQHVVAGENYWLKAFVGRYEIECLIPTDPANADTIDFDTNYKTNSNKLPTSNVVTASEVNDKTLRTFCMFNETDSTGEVVFCVKVPSNGRYVAYGDIEFENRSYGDHVSAIEVVDIDRMIAWGAALEANPLATSPVSDEDMQGVYPHYPVIGHYDEKNLDIMVNENTSGTLKGGMAMTMNYGITEAQPIGGYGFLPGDFYFRIKAKKSVAESGHKCQISIDWAELNA